MSKSFRSVSSRLSRRLLLITNAIFIAGIIAVGIISTRITKADADNYANQSLQNAILHVEKILVDVKSSTDAISLVICGDEISDSRSVALAEELLDADSCMVSCAIAFEPEIVEKESRYSMSFSFHTPENGEIISKSMGGKEYDYHTTDWYQIPKLTGKEYWSEPTFDAEGSGTMITSYCKPLFDNGGNFIGVIRSDIALNWLTERVQNLKPFKSAFTILAGRNGSFISHPDSERILNETIFTHAIATGNDKEMAACKQMHSGVLGSVLIKMNDDYVYGTYAPLKNGWSVIMFCQAKDMYFNISRIILILTIISLLGLLIVYIFSKKSIDSSIMPLTEFSYVVRSIGMGFFNARIPSIETNDEIKQLENSIRYVQKSINTYIKELKETTASNERIESELNIARSIQQQMLPKEFPQNDITDIHAFIEPAKEVGGDLYDFDRRDNLLNFAIGDVSGKGVPAAMLMAITRSTLRFLSGTDLGTDGVAFGINNIMAHGNESQMFVTLFIARVNLDDMHMEFCNMGHNPLVLVHPDGSAQFIEAKPNIAAGLLKDFPYQSQSLQLEKGCRIIAYTDGITEAETATKEQFGESRLLEFASHLDPHSTSREVSDSLIAAVRAFTGGNDQNDDITVMTITF